MSEPFLAEIKIFGFNFAPRGFATCDGQILPINQNQSLYSLLGTTYGGDGRTSFGLPDLRSRVPIHVGNGHTWGQKGGAESVVLTQAEMPTHNHRMEATSANASDRNALGNIYARSGSNAYHAPGTQVAMRSGAVVNAGNSQAHNNMQPYLTINFCIALQGTYPSRN